MPFGWNPFSRVEFPVQASKDAPAMTIQDELLSIERGFWTGGADYYRQNLDDLCMTVFTEMAGAFKREEIAGMIADMDRWRELKLDVKGCLEPAFGFAILTYAVKATRKNNEAYAAAVTSGYVKRNGAWKMVLHQQTPLSASNSREKS
jgi:hypothetical protein